MTERDLRRRGRMGFAREELAGIGCIAAVLAASNFAVRFVINDWLTWGAFTYPVSFLVIDCLNRLHGPAAARKVVWAGFAIGAPMSFLFNLALPEPGQSFGEIALLSARIAAASGLAFLCSQLLDVRVFSSLRHRAWWIAPSASSAAGSVVDTFLFFFVAFAFTGVPWVTLALGDLAAKGAMVLLLLPPYRKVTGFLAARREAGAGSA